MGSPETSASTPRWPRRIAYGALGCGVVGSALAWGAHTTWLGALCAELGAHFAWGGAVVTALLLWCRAWPAATLAAALSIAHAAPAASAVCAPWDEGESIGTVAVANVLTPTTHFEDLRRWLGKEEVIVAGLIEVSYAWSLALATWDEFPHQLVEADEGNFGLAILSRYPLRDAQLHVFDGYPLVSAVAEVPGGDVSVWVGHPFPPGPFGMEGERQRYLRWMEERVEGERLVVMGDFNATESGPTYRRLRSALGVRESRRACRRQTTWPAPLRGLGFPLDHIWVGDDVGVAARRVGPAGQSDHHPVAADLVWLATP